MEREMEEGLYGRELIGSKLYYRQLYQYHQDVDFNLTQLFSSIVSVAVAVAKMAEPGSPRRGKMPTGYSSAL